MLGGGGVFSTSPKNRNERGNMSTMVGSGTGAMYQSISVDRSGGDVGTIGGRSRGRRYRTIVG